MQETQHRNLSWSERPRRERGFSMAEVLVATAMLSVILLAVFGLITAGVSRAYGGKKMTEGSALAEAVMERANIIQPQDLLSGASTTQRTITWTKTANNTLDASVTPAAEANPGPTVPITERNAWRSLLRFSDLPANATNPARLTVTMTAMPDAAPDGPRTFTTANTVRIVVEVSWKEFGNRTRTVRLQTFNARSTTL